MAAIVGKINWLYHEFGLSSVVYAGKDAWIIILQRSLRMFAYGTNALILALFFASMDFSDYQIGLFMTLTLAGDVVLGTLVTLVADRVGRRKVLLLGSVLMVLSGTVFALFENFWILLFAAVVGIISATGGDFGPFRSIEESIISGLTSENARSDVLSWYVTFSSLGSSVGSEISGRIVHYLQGRAGWTLKDAYHAMFYIYTAMGIANFLFVLCLSDQCEIEPQPAIKSQPVPQSEEEEFMLASSDDDSESDDGSATLQGTPTTPHPSDLRQTGKPLYRTAEDTSPPSKFRRIFTFFTKPLSEISTPSLKIMYTLWALLALDCLADGMVPYSLTTYYMDLKFSLPKSTLGDVMSVSYLLASLSTIFSAPLARRLGLVNTMVFTHVPSSAAVLLFPVGNSAALTITLLLVRTGLNNMDQAPRSAFIAAAVRPEERTAIMGITGMIRTLAATVGPSITGVLAGKGNFWIAFVAAGLCRLSYDFGLWALFKGIKFDEGNGSVASKSSGDDPRRRRESDEEEGEGVEMSKL